MGLLSWLWWGSRVPSRANYSFVVNQAASAQNRSLAPEPLHQGLDLDQHLMIRSGSVTGLAATAAVAGGPTAETLRVVVTRNGEAQPQAAVTLDGAGRGTAIVVPGAVRVARNDLLRVFAQVSGGALAGGLDLRVDVEVTYDS